MSEWNDFDRDLTEALTELPPSGGTVRAVTPWREATDRIVLGLGLTCFTPRFALLDYVLPAVGAVQLYLGFRALRKNNHSFQFCWIFSICKVILLYINFVLCATPYADFLSVPRTALQTVLTLLLFAALRQGLRQASGELGRGTEGDPVLWALLWYLLVIVLALFRPQPGWLAGGAVLITFGCIIRSLRRAAAHLDSWSYAIRPAPVKVGAKQVQWLFYGALLALIAICVLCSSHIRLDGIPIEQKFDSPETTATRDRLLELGFPREMLDFLPAEELEKLTDASACVYQPNDPNGSWDTELDGRPFTTSGAMVYLGDGTARFYVLAAYGDGINAFWQNLAEFKNSGVTRWDGGCYLTYRKGADVYRTVVPVEETWETVDNFFTSPTEETRIRARYSFPARSSQRTCLFVCTLRLSEWEGQNPGGVSYIHDCIVNFYRRRLPMGFPYQPLSGGGAVTDLAQYCQHFQFLLPHP